MAANCRKCGNGSATGRRSSKDAQPTIVYNYIHPINRFDHNYCPFFEGIRSICLVITCPDVTSAYTRKSVNYAYQVQCHMTLRRTHRATSSVVNELNGPGLARLSIDIIDRSKYLLLVKPVLAKLLRTGCHISFAIRRR